MSISATTVRFDEHTMWVDLSDGRTIGVPLAWFPRLLRATPAERERFEISRVGLHWEEIDEDISIASLLNPEKFMRLANHALQQQPLPARSRRSAVPSARKKRSPRRG